MFKKRTLKKHLIIICIMFSLIFIGGCLNISDNYDDYGEEIEESEEPKRLRSLVNKMNGIEGSEDNDSEAYADVAPVSVGSDAHSATVMVFMNGSDLETEAGEATTDISEMIASGVGENVNVIIQTMGTKKWHRYGISSKTAQTYRIENGKLVLVRDNLGQLSCTSSDTLSDFIGFCKTNYPADRYIFQFWDHGGGPIYGFGYDEWRDEENGLNIAEMADASAQHKDIHFDIIGMDCCIMASVETCLALAPYCKYALLSEDFESGLGWSYTEWMRKLEEEPGTSTPLLGKYIIDSTINENETDIYGDSSCFTLFNESAVSALFSAWMDYAYKNESSLLNTNYSKSHRAKRIGSRSLFDDWFYDGSNVTISNYYITDMLALVEGVDSESNEAKSLMSALKACIAYYGHTSDKNELTGMAVSLPYGDLDFYNSMAAVFKSLKINQEYIEWLRGFTRSYSTLEYYDYDDFEQSWEGWGEYEDEDGCSDGSCAIPWYYGGSVDGYDDSDSAETSDYNDYCNSDSCDDWIYDYEDELWYHYEDDILYIYDDETDMMFYYDEYSDALYYYDDENDQWYKAE